MKILKKGEILSNILKKGRMLSKKTLSVIIAGIVLATGTVYISVATYKNNNNPSEFKAREREYTVVKGNITAGVKGGGSIQFEGIKHNFDESIVIGEVFVKEGDYVKKGDELLSISEKYLRDKLKEANENLSKAKSNLEKVNNDKELAILNNNKSWSDKVQTSRNQYESQRRKLDSSINTLKGKLSTIKSQIDEVRKKMEDLSSNSDNNKEIIEELKVKEASLILEKNSVENELETTNTSLRDLERDREDQLKEEAKEANSNNTINNLTIKGLQEAISGAQDEVNKTQEEVDKLKRLEESPILYAKVDGVVKTISNTDGTQTNISGSIVEIGQAENIIAEITVSQNDIINIKEGQEVKLEISTYQDEKFTGKVKSINLKPNTEGGATNFKVVVAIDKTQNKLLEGMTVNAQFIIKEVKNVVMLSNKAVILKDGKQYVKLKNKDGSITDVNIKTGFSDGKNTEIISGLNEGDTVVIGG